MGTEPLVYDLQLENSQLTAQLLECKRVEATLHAEIAERQRVEAALRKSESRFQTLAASGVIGIITTSFQGSIVDANAAFLELLGYTRDELISGQLRWDELTPPEWLEQDARLMERSQTTRVAPPYEKELIHKDGRRIPVLLGGAVLDGTVDDGICFVLDLSDRKRAAKLREAHAIAEAEVVQRQRMEAALRRSESRFERLADSGILGIITGDYQGNITYANAAFLGIIGYSRDDLTSGRLRWDALTPPEWLEQDARVIEQCRSTGVTPVYEKEFLHKDGHRIPVLMGGAELDSTAGEGICFVLDLQDRKRAEELREARQRAEAALRKSELLFQGLVDSGILGVVTADTSGRILNANLTFLEMIGYSEDDLAAKKIRWDQLAPPEWREQGERVLEQSRSTKVVRAYETEFIRKDGRRIPVLLGGAMFEDKADEGVGFVLDLSDRKRADDLHEAHAVAEAASRAKSEFLSSMSHELRTPLNAILGFAQLLQRDKKQPLSDRHRDRVEQIVNGGEHLLRLIEDILDLSRIESGGVAVSIEPTNAYEVIEQLMPTLEPLAARSYVTVTLAAAPENVPLVAADRTRLTQILMNFASNAIKYNRLGGKVRLHLSRDDPDYVRLVVSDTGLGIPSEKQDKLFQAFQRAGQETGTVEGTGIGLFIAKRLAQLMRGDVGFRSMSGQGSDFWVDIPLARGQQVVSTQSTRASQAKATALKGRRIILHVEDNPSNLGFMHDLVTNLFDDVALLSATTGELGVALARVHRLDAIIMDINLPGMSGLDALYELRNDPTTQHVPVIAVSAAASAHDKQHGLRAGFVAYLTKPVNVDEFVTVIRGLFPSHEGAS